MNEWGVFLVIGSILSFIGVVYKMFYKPMHDLVIELVRLNGNLEYLNKSDERQNKEIEKLKANDVEQDKEIERLKSGQATLIRDVKYIKDRV